MTPKSEFLKFFYKKYIYIYIYVCVCVCVCNVFNNTEYYLIPVHKGRKWVLFFCLSYFIKEIKFLLNDVQGNFSSENDYWVKHFNTMF